MTWRVLISAPYLLPLPEEFRSRLEKEGAEIVTVDVSERLSEDKTSLSEFSQLAPTPLEKAESIDMLRAREHGRRVHLVETKIDTHAVDTVEDLILVEGLMKEEAAGLTEPSAVAPDAKGTSGETS